MTHRSAESDRAHNFRIVGTKRNEGEELNLEWQALESELLAAAAYDPPRRRLYLRFHSGDVYRYYTFPPEQYRELLEAESHGRYFLTNIRNHFPYERLPRR